MILDNDGESDSTDDPVIDEAHEGPVPPQPGEFYFSLEMSFSSCRATSSPVTSGDLEASMLKFSTRIASRGESSYENWE